MDTEVNAFLEHHGVKGQKWGIRNDKAGNYTSPFEKAKQERANETPQERRARQKRNQKRVQLATKATSLALAAAYIAAILHSSGKRSSNNLRKDGPSFRKDPHDGRITWNIHKNHDPNIIRMQERQRNGAHQISEYLKRQGHEVLPRDPKMSKFVLNPKYPFAAGKVGSRR